jgi:ribosomal protein L37AE/L43A
VEAVNWSDAELAMSHAALNRFSSLQEIWFCIHCTKYVEGTHYEQVCPPVRIANPGNY